MESSFRSKQPNITCLLHSHDLKASMTFNRTTSRTAGVGTSARVVGKDGCAGGEKLGPEVDYQEGSSHTATNSPVWEGRLVTVRGPTPVCPHISPSLPGGPREPGRNSAPNPRSHEDPLFLPPSLSSLNSPKTAGQSYWAGTTWEHKAVEGSRSNRS